MESSDNCLPSDKPVSPELERPEIIDDIALARIEMVDGKGLPHDAAKAEVIERLGAFRQSELR